MRDELLLYYERELTYLRQMAVQFAEKYPKVASRLVLEPNKCDDPHVERLLEGVAYLAARVHLKLDDDFPEITEAMLGIVYPHLVRPLPSMSIVEFQPDEEQGKLSSGLPVERGTTLYSKPVNGVPCKFRTCYETVLWPVSVARAEYRPPDRLTPPLRATDANGAIRLELKAGPDVQFQKLGMDRLRLYLNGESQLVHTLYELLGSRLVRVVVRDPSPGSRVRPVTLPASAVQPVGFGEDEGMIPYPRRSFVGYRLLQELFAFPQKFFFIDLVGLEAAWAGGFGGAAEVVFLLDMPSGTDEWRQRLELGLSDRTFRLGCAPVVNLFPHTAEPLLLDQQRYEYPVIPDVRRPHSLEVFSVDEVVSINPKTDVVVNYEPFYSFRPNRREGRTPQAFWLSHRRPSGRPNDDGSDVSLSLVDLSLRPRRPEADTLTVRATCTNRDLPARLPFGNEAGDFEMDTGAPVKRIMTLVKPTAPIRPPGGRSAQWNLVSHLSLNHLSLVSEGREALQQILRLYNPTDSNFAQRMIEGITRVESSRRTARVLSDGGISFARGQRVEVEFDEEQFVGGGVYLFASVLEQFLGLYASLNSFTQLAARSRQRKEALREWPPRAGRRILA